VGIPADHVYKTLVVQVNEPKSKPLLVMVAADRTLDLKRLAQAVGVRKLHMARHADAERLTGLKVGGERILILVDGSASMLDSSIVNIIRRRNMSDPEKLKSRKWQRTVNAVDWLSTQIPVDSQFQIYLFNTSVHPSLPDSLGDWVDVDSGRNLNTAIDGVRSFVPGGGTSLHAAFAAARALKPMPDNIYLLTDSLPTQGDKPPRGTTVNGKTRIKHFEDAVATLPLGIPVNIILLPMEGDPMASAAFWQLAQVTGGSFMSPSKDWP
jgi:hypothetical protein